MYLKWTEEAICFDHPMSVGSCLACSTRKFLSGFLVKLVPILIILDSRPNITKTLDRLITGS